MSPRRAAVAARTRAFALVAVAALALALGGCKGKEAQRPALADALATVRVLASGATLPLLLETANQYMRAHPNVLVLVDGDDEADAARQVADKTISLAVTNLNVTDERNLLDVRPYVTAPLAIVANRGDFDERVDNLTQAQLRAIFTGRINNWSAVGGGEQRIIVIDRRGSGEHVALARWLGVGDFAPAASDDTRAPEVQSTVLARLGSLSYAALPFRHPALKVLSLDGVAPSVQAFKDGRYVLCTRERVVVRKDADAATRAFADSLFSGEVRDELLEQLGYVAADAPR